MRAMLSTNVDTGKIIYFNVKGEISFFCSIYFLLYQLYGRPEDGVQSQPKHVAASKIDKNLCVTDLGCM
jgi:hypothetical protein